MNTDSESKNDYKLIGQFESEKEIIPLPPTPITPLAERMLLEKNFTKEMIQQLREFCSSFRYDLCLEKVERLTAYPINLYQNGNDEYVEIPHFFDAYGRLDGQCYDIAIQFIQKSAKLIEEFNRNMKLAPGFKLVNCLCTGLSKTHFITESLDPDNPSSKHIWNELAIVDPDGVIMWSILTDVAFQKISGAVESGYQRKSTVCDPVVVMTNPKAFIKVNPILADREVDIHPGNMEALVLGISQDRQYVYSLAVCRRGSVGMNKEAYFVNDVQKKFDPITVLIRTLPDGYTQSFFLTDDGILLSNGLIKDLKEEEEKEIVDILKESLKFTFIRK